MPFGAVSSDHAAKASAAIREAKEILREKLPRKRTCNGAVLSLIGAARRIQMSIDHIESLPWEDREVWYARLASARTYWADAYDQVAKRCVRRKVRWS